MAQQRIHNSLGAFDTLTKDELKEGLDDTFTRHLRARYRSLKLMKLPVIQQTAPASGTFTLAPTGSGLGAPCGPEQGFIWQLQRVMIASSGGYLDTSGSLTGASLGSTGTVVTPGAFASICTVTLPATGVAVVWTLQWQVAIATATASLANNFVLQANGVTKGISMNGLAIGQYAQLPFTYIQPAGGSQLVTIKATGADATGTYTAQLAVNPNQIESQVGLGDAAQVSYLYCGSDTSLNQNSIIDGIGVVLGRAWTPGSKAAWVFPGESLYALIANATQGYVYSITGVAIQVAMEEIGKLL